MTCTSRRKATPASHRSIESLVLVLLPRMENMEKIQAIEKSDNDSKAQYGDLTIFHVFVLRNSPERSWRSAIDDIPDLSLVIKQFQSKLPTRFEVATKTYSATSASIDYPCLDYGHAVCPQIFLSLAGLAITTTFECPLLAFAGLF